MLVYWKINTDKRIKYVMGVLKKLIIVIFNKELLELNFTRLSCASGLIFLSPKVSSKGTQTWKYIRGKKYRHGKSGRKRHTGI